MSSDVHDTSELEKTKTLGYDVREITVIPTGINTAIKDNEWKRLLVYGTLEMSKLAYLGSTLFNLHLLRLLNSKEFSLLSKDFFKKSANMRSWYVGVSPDAKKTKDEFLDESIKIWKDTFPKEQELPSMVGLGSIVNGQYETYYTCFKNYHTFAIRNHFSWYIKDKYDVSKKKSMVISEAFFKVKNEVELDNNDEYQITLDDEADKILEKEKEIFKKFDVESLKDRISIHFLIQDSVVKSNDKDETKNKAFAIAPICSLKTRHINVCKSGLKDLYGVCKTMSNSKKELGTKYRGISIETANEIVKKECPERIGDVLFDDKLKRKHKQIKGFDYSLEFKTNGIEVKLVWEKTVHKTIKVTKQQFEKHMKDKEKRLKEKKEKLEKQEENNGKIDKRSTIKRAPKIEKTSTFPSKLPFDNETNGFFSKTAIIDSNIKEGTLIVACDPGHKNIVTTSRAMYKKDTDSLVFKKGYSLSLGQYYNDIGHKQYLRKNEKRKRENEDIQKIELEWSKHSLKVNNVSNYLDKLKVQLKNWGEYSEFYRSKKMIRLSFSNLIKKQKLIQEVEKKMCPNKDTIIANGSANFAKSRPGLSATPVAKVMKKISESKRVALTPEQYTTCRCSMCKHTVDKMSDLYGNEKYNDKKGVMRFRKIHGLKQCTHCSRLWSRDLNAAINIGNAFVQLNKYGTRPNYLTPMMPSDLSTQGCDMRMQMCQPDAIPQSYPDVRENTELA